MLEDLDIQKMPTRKDNIKQPLLAEANIIPRLNTPSLFVGNTGSGKTNLLCNFLQNKLFYRKVFDRIIWISPTALTDDLQIDMIKELKIPDDDVITKLEEAPMILSAIQEEQRLSIAEFGPVKTDKYLIYCDDLVSNRDVMTTQEFTDIFIMCRHFNCTTWFASQTYKGLPRACRLQAKHIFYFRGSHDETECIMEDHCPPGFTRKIGQKMVAFATGEPFSFLYINRTVPMAERYRKNLKEIITIQKS